MVQLIIHSIAITKGVILKFFQQFQALKVARNLVEYFSGLVEKSQFFQS